MQPDGVNPPATQLLDQRIDAALEKRGLGVDGNAGVSGGGGSGGGTGLEARVAKVEASVENIDRTIADVKGELKTLRENARTDFRLLFGAIIAVALGLASLIAKGFHWI